MKFQQKEFKKQLKKGTLLEPLCMVIDTEKSISIDNNHLAIIGIKLDKNLRPETIINHETGEVTERKIAIIVDGPPQTNGNMTAYYRNMAPYETRELLIAQALDPNTLNPVTRVGASVIMYHEAVSADQNIMDKETGISYPTYKASRYSHRAGITPEDAAQRMFYGIRMKMNIVNKDTENQRISFDAYDLRKQIKICNAIKNEEEIKKALEEVFDHIYSQYKDPEYNKGAVVLSFFTKTKDGELKRIGKMVPTDKEKSSWEYNTAPFTYTTYNKNDNNKSKREPRNKAEFVEDTLKFIKKTISKFENLDLVITPKYSLDIDNLAKSKFRMEEFLINKLSSDFHDSTILTSPNRHFKYFQFYQYDPQPAPYNIYEDTKTEIPVMTFEEYEAIQKKQQSSAPKQTETHQKEPKISYTTFDDEEDPFGPTPF